MHEADDASALSNFLASRDVPCPGCRYNLRGLTTGRCPECAQQLTLGVAAQNPWPRGFIAGVIGLASGAGFSGLLLAYVLIRLTLSGGGSAPRAFIPTVACGAAIQSLLLIALLASGASFRSMTPLRRGFLVVGCWAVTLINLLVFTFLSR